MLSSKNRLTKAFFREIHPRPELLRGEHLALARYKGDSFSFPRVAVVVPKKIEKLAVERNRTKRRILAVLQEFLSQLSVHEALVFRVHTTLDHVSYTELKEEIARLIGGQK